jgi:uncharacterized protein YfaS (alpha-2-macroglobulin family)
MYSQKNNNDSSARQSTDDEEGGGSNTAAGKHFNVKHVEYRDDRFVAALDMRFPHQSEVLLYLMRAVTPGDYSVPAPLVESMYKPEVRSIGETPSRTKIQ